MAGITGAGKSSLTNAVFGASLAQAGAGMPVTQHFQKYEPSDKPIVIYDSKGLEFAEHQAFIKETGKFFSELRMKKDVSEHIHVVWYVINAARGRFENFEANLVREVFNPTPVVFVLNKADLADSKQLKAIKKVVEDEKFPNTKGVHVVVSDRTNWTQSWCPECLSDDVYYDEETKELECSECGFTCKQDKSYGLKSLIKQTCELLPELAKDAFMFSQTASVGEKDKRSKYIVKQMSHGMSMDASGSFIKKVAEMCAKLFVIWGWPLTAETFRDGLAQMQKEYVHQLKFRERLAVAAVDKVLGSRLSRAFTGIIGITMNRGMKKLNEELIEQCAKGKLENVKMEDFMGEADLNEDLIRLFFQSAVTEGIDTAIDKYWDLSSEELIQLAQQLNISSSGEDDFFGGLTKLDTSKLDEIIEAEDVEIAEVDVDSKNKDKDNVDVD